jgi:hypothetical protein
VGAGLLLGGKPQNKLKPNSQLKVKAKKMSDNSQTKGQSNGNEDPLAVTVALVEVSIFGFGKGSNWAMSMGHWATGIKDARFLMRVLIGFFP